MYDIILFGDMPDLDTYSRSTGCHRLATELRKHNYSVLVVDYGNYINLDRFKQLIDLIVGPNTLFVGFSSTWYPWQLTNGDYAINEPSKPHNKYTGPVIDDSIQVNFAKHAIVQYTEYIRKANNNTKIILGGSKVYMYFLPLIDNFFIGYSDTMIIDYANSLSGRGQKRLFSKIVDYDSKARDSNWDFRDAVIEYPEESFILPTETLLLEVGRGCRFRCSFCSYPLIGEKNTDLYLKHEEVLYNELYNNYIKHGVTKYVIVDDTFNDSTEKLERVLSVVKRLPFKPKFWCYCRIDLIATHNEHIQLLKDIGIREVYFGIETFNVKAGRTIGKGMNPDRIKRTLEQCHSVWGRQVNIMTGLICGLPNDNVSDFENSCRYFDNTNGPVGHVNVTPLRIFKYKNDYWNKYKFKAEFESNAEQYGYTWPDENIPWYWIKNDGTDVTDYYIANELAVKWQNILDKHYTFLRCFFYTSCLLDNRFDYDILMELSSTDEFNNHIGNTDIRESMRTQIEEYYFKPLFSFITSKRHQILGD